MITIALVSQKGGSGKTTLATHLAAKATQAGYVTCLIDTDPQATAAAWGDWRGKTDPEVITAPPARLARVIEDAQKLGAEFLVIDTPPFAEAAAREAVKAADVVLIPCRPRAFDLHAIQATADLIRSTRKAAYVVFNATPPRAPALIADASKMVESFGLEVAPISLAERAAFNHSTANGRTAVETEPSGKAAEEIDRLWKWLCERASTPPQKHASENAL